ncbi:MAG: stealth family protein [Lachnospiraceae bacterium]|nr:stealth family protein [Lachnospiraceae bacterium]MCM1239450.1 stealth family protein [Lachnospiraceae bacterium]
MHLKDDMDQQIDFVITWIDGQNEAWRKEKSMFQPDRRDDDQEARYRDWGLLKYWFRGVDKFAPWVRKIHFITWGYVPEWLNTGNPRLHVVQHKDYVPEQYLPVYNSNVLEIYMHRIEGLAEHFVYFNDDMFLIRNVRPSYFFRHGQPCDMLAFQPVVANPANPLMSHLYLNNTLALSRHFVKRENIRRQPGKYFNLRYPPLYFFYNLLELAFPLYTGFYTVHGPSPFCKSTFEEVWEKEREALEEMSFNRFRSEGDLTPYLFREWQKLSGRFYPWNIRKDFRYFGVGSDNTRLLRTISRQRKRVICINDTVSHSEFESADTQLKAAFQQILPERSAFE